MKITTMAEALSLVPEYWPLVPGVDKWDSQDEWYFEKVGWETIGTNWDGKPVDCIGRRHVPQSVREAEARWILYNSLADGKPQEFYYALLLVPDIEDDESLSIAIGEISYGSSAPTFSTKEKAKCAFKILGGESAVIQMLTEGPGALFRWVEENRK